MTGFDKEKTDKKLRVQTLVVTDSGVCGSEPRSIIPVGATYAAIEEEMEKRFKGKTDKDFQDGSLGFRANSRKDHIRQITCREFDRQLSYALAGRIMSEFRNAEWEQDGGFLAFELRQLTDEEWAEIEKDSEEGA